MCGGRLRVLYGVVGEQVTKEFVGWLTLISEGF